MATRHTYAGSQQHFNGSTAGDQSREGFTGQAQAAGQAIQSQAEHYVADYPLSTVLAVFGIGLGVGAVLGCAMMSSTSSSYSSSNYLPSGSSSWWPSSSSSWLPSMSSNSSSWMPSSSNSSWFSGSNSPSAWGDSLVRGAKNMMNSSCGY